MSKKMNNIDVVLFDMFNTLANNSIEFWVQKFEKLVLANDINASPLEFWNTWREGDKDFSRSRVAPDSPFISYLEGWTKSFEYALTETNNSGDAQSMAQSCIDDLANRPLFTETMEVLNELSLDYRIGIASNADNNFLYPVVRRIDFKPEVVISSEDVRSYKPMPDIFNEALRLLDVDASRVMYVGDRQYEDVQGPISVGMNAVWVNRKNEPVDLALPRPYSEISDLTGLLDLLRK